MDPYLQAAHIGPTGLYELLDHLLNKSKVDLIASKLTFEGHD